MSSFVKTINLSSFQHALYNLFPGLKKTFVGWFGIADCDAVLVHDIIFPRDNRFMNEKFLLNLSAGAVEKEEIALCLKHLQSNSRIVEIGSGLGIAASIINKAKTPDLHICFEVNPLARQYCEALVKLNNLELNIIGSALGDGEATKFYLCEDYVRSSLIQPSADIPHKAIDIDTTSISNMLQTHQPNVLICDIEGAEAQFIKPAELTNIHSVMIELHPKIYGIDMYHEIIERFTSAGFKVTETQEDCVFFQRETSSD